MQAIDITRNISIASIALTYAEYSGKYGVPDAEEALDTFRGNHAEAFDRLKTWADNLCKQTSELEAVLKRFACGGVGKICR